MSQRLPRNPNRPPRTRRLDATTDRELAAAVSALHRPAGHQGLDGIARRRFLQGMLATGGVAALGSSFFSEQAAAGPPLGQDDRILVMLLQGGGNDGLNTLIPKNDGIYRDKRGGLAVTQGGTHNVGEGLHLHYNLDRLKSRFDQGDVAIVRGVGDPLDDRSHFVNMARWMGGTSDNGPWFNGWLGRYLDGIGADGLGGVNIGYQGVPLHLQRANGETTALPPNGNLFGSDFNDNTWNRPAYDALLGINAQSLGLGHWPSAVAASTGSSIATADTVGSAFSPEIDEDEDELVHDAIIAGRLINLDIGVRVIGISIDGHDHHDDQRPQHDDFMLSIDRAIDTLFATVNSSLRDRVMLMTFSEFGRRVEANGSGGTDHGTAGTLFVVGSGVTGGLYGEQPPLNDLDNRGDMKHTVNFRSVYATVLDDWLNADSTEILGANYENLGFLRQTCNGEVATIVGTAASETITGTSGRDVIVGLGGSDLIYGRGGNDLICAGPGNDTVFGEGGNDDVFGGSGNDDLRGGDGNDYLRGDDGNDQIRGGRGVDHLRGNAGADQLVGSRAEDTFTTGASDVILRGQ